MARPLDAVLATAAGLLLAWVPTSAASAASIRYAFSGTITSVDAPLASAFSVGEAVSVVAVIDDATVPLQPDAQTSQYIGPAVSADFGSLSAVANPPGSSIGIVDSAGQDEFRISGAGLIGTPPVGSFVATNITLLLADPSATAFSSQALPTSLALGAFTGHTARFIFQDPGAMTTARVHAEVTGASVTVPEPGAGLLAAVALGLLAAAGRRPTLR